MAEFGNSITAKGVSASHIRLPSGIFRDSGGFSVAFCFRRSQVLFLFDVHYTFICDICLCILCQVDVGVDTRTIGVGAFGDCAGARYDSLHYCRDKPRSDVFVSSGKSGFDKKREVDMGRLLRPSELLQVYAGACGDGAVGNHIIEVRI
jgi:hypothetical protein